MKGIPGTWDRVMRTCASCGTSWALGQYPPDCRNGGMCHTAETRRAASIACPDTYSCERCGAKFPDNGEPWVEHLRKCLGAAPQEEPVRCQAETRQLDKINRALLICDQVERNPEGWGGPQAVSLARTIRQALTGQPVTPHANYGGQGD